MVRIFSEPFFASTIDSDLYRKVSRIVFENDDDKDWIITVDVNVHVYPMLKKDQCYTIQLGTDRNDFSSTTYMKKEKKKKYLCCGRIFNITNTTCVNDDYMDTDDDYTNAVDDGKDVTQVYISFGGLLMEISLPKDNFNHRYFVKHLAEKNTKVYFQIEEAC